MPKVTIGPALPDRETLSIEIARLRGLDIKELRSRWHTVLGSSPPSHLPRHLLFRVVAYRRRIQPVVATPFLSASLKKSSSTSAGVFQPRVLRGLVLST